jgi:TPP-dependent pyruvate/acetoin dehydrogenase alpha subunit
MRGGKSVRKTTTAAGDKDGRLVRFDFPPEAVAGLDFKAMAEAFQEFAKKAREGRLDNEPPAG